MECGDFPGSRCRRVSARDAAHVLWSPAFSASVALHCGRRRAVDQICTDLHLSPSRPSRAAPPPPPPRRYDHRFCDEGDTYARMRPTDRPAVAAAAAWLASAHALFWRWRGDVLTLLAVRDRSVDHASDFLPGAFSPVCACEGTERESLPKAPRPHREGASARLDVQIPLDDQTCRGPLPEPLLETG